MKFIWLFIIILSACAPKRELESISLNNRGVGLLKGENTTGAQESFIEALSRKPFEPALHNNLGVALDGSKEIEKAIKSYHIAADRAEEPKMKFATKFNLAQALAKQGQIDEALRWYQGALDADPSSKEVKTNIELLLNQQGGKGKGESDSQDKKPGDDKDGEGKDQKDSKDKEKDKGYAGNQKYKPRPFKGELSEGDVKKILGELKQQEQKIRADYNRKEAKEAPRDKDW